MNKMANSSFQNCLDKGKKYFDKEDYVSALEQFKAILKNDSQNKEALFETGKMYYVMEDYPTAMKFLKKAVQLDPCNKYGHMLLTKVYIELGKVYRKGKDYGLAIETLKQAIRLGLENEDLHLQLSNAYWDNGKYASALEEFKKASSYSQDNRGGQLELERLLGRLCIKIREDGISAEEFDRLIQIIEKPFLKNKMLNEWEISQRKVVLKSKPRALLVTLTTKCNLRCDMCDVWKHSWDIPEKIVKEIIALFPYLGQIIWQGGEVFLSDYLRDIIDEAKKFPNLRQSITTNGLLINEEWAEKLVSSNVDLTVSIDGVTKEVYEKIRKGAKFEDLLRSIHIFNKCRKSFSGKIARTTMNVVVMKSNVHQLSKFPDFAKEYEFDALRFTPIERMDERRARVDEENIFLSKNREMLNYIKKIMPGVLKKVEDYGIALDGSLPLYQNNGKETKRKEVCAKFDCKVNQRKGLLCYLPWQSLLIEAGGKVIPHCFCKKKVGNICNSSLEEIWNSDMMQICRKKIIEGKYHEICNPQCSSGIIPNEYLRL